MSYDPGTPTTPRPIDAQTWAIDSFRDAQATSYQVRVTPAGCTCTCPHYTTRLAGLENAECKHIISVLARIQRATPTAFQTAAERARKLSDAKLAFWLKQHQEAGNAPVQSAILCEMAARKLASDRDAALKALWK